jgi:hypothetical protein
MVAISSMTTGEEEEEGETPMIGGMIPMATDTTETTGT